MTTGARHEVLPITVDPCPRCRQSHQDLPFFPLSHPPLGISHWATCPETQQPLLLAVREDLPLTPDKVVSQ